MLGGGDQRLRECQGAGYFTPKSKYQVHALDINWGCEVSHTVCGGDLWGKGGVVVEQVCGWEHKNEWGQGLACVKAISFMS